MIAAEGTFQNFIRERNKTMISKTWQGYYISKRVRNSEFHHYVKSIYKGEITWTTDYTYAKHYSEKTAKRLDAEIEESLLNGTCNNEFIIADSEVQETPEVVEEVAEEQQPEVKRYDLGNVRCTLEQTSTRHGYYRVTVEWDGHTFVNRFRSRAEAIEEILSYAEVDEF